MTTPSPPRPPGWRLWLPLAIAIFFPLALVVQMWWTGIPFSTPMVGLLGVWLVMTMYFVVSLRRKRRRYLGGD